MNIVLVHGAGGTPTTWSFVLPMVHARGHVVSAVTNPMTSLEDDIATTTAWIDENTDGDVLLVGHSYGGAVITGAGHHPRVKGLVYVAAWAPDQDESIQDILARYDVAPVNKHMVRGADGSWQSSRSPEYYAEIAWDLPPERREVWSAEGRPSSNEIFAQKSGVPAWKTRPSWYLVAAQDKTLRVDTQRDMAARMRAVTSEVDGSHFVPQVSPGRVADLIEEALS
ncbi:alpha/beta fold hydrolase [Kineosporia succinea]|uniref:Pimeloyl-ACP methyl ester carboxylesterase n=1 Tax=Kineosporia succinea TaxID=84632 RepID=A0ABT9P794_9ACTN|nr:alpha/beta hydrolase [Kineosporia succinea]MDP9828562.1 pimeloyl-ACP methyl ester carboxylesterase [Kineosporia succinea]